MSNEKISSDKKDFAVSHPNSENLSVGERLQSAVKKAGGSKHISTVSKIPSPTIYGYINGRQLPANAAYKLAAACGVSLEWLITGSENGPSLPPVMRGAETVTDAQTGEEHSLSDVIEFRKYEVHLSAGHGAVAHIAHEFIPSFIAIPRYFLPKEIIAAAPHLIAVDVSGDSMTPTLSDGDTLLVDTRVQSVISGSVYAIRAEDEVLVKRLNRHLDGNIEVISDNPRFKPQLIEAATARRLWADGEAPLKIIGRVLWRMGSTI